MGLQDTKGVYIVHDIAGEVGHGNSDEAEVPSVLRNDELHSWAQADQVLAREQVLVQERVQEVEVRGEDRKRGTREQRTGDHKVLVLVPDLGQAQEQEHYNARARLEVQEREGAEQEDQGQGRETPSSNCGRLFDSIAGNMDTPSLSRNCSIDRGYLGIGLRCSSSPVASRNSACLRYSTRDSYTCSRLYALWPMSIISTTSTNMGPLITACTAPRTV